MTIIIYSISKIGIQYESKETMKMIRAIFQLLFTAVNGYMLLPYTFKKIEQIKNNAIKEETLKKMNPDIKDTDKGEISDIIAVAALRYADLLPNSSTDYIFDEEKFSDLNGKTGAYLLYSTIC